MNFRVRSIFTRLFPKNLLAKRMDVEEETLHYSHAKLTSYINNRDNKDEAVHEYLKTLQFQPIKDFEKGLEWFNVSQPLSFRDQLKGKVVLLDFFTYCCINCMHIIPDLRELEHEFSIEDGFVVIGVHSAKFDNEKSSNNILSAVQRYNIQHPVVNDHRFEMWKACDVECWPTLLLLGPTANPIVMLMGEGHKNDLRLYIRNALSYYGARGEISRHSLPLDSAYHLLPDLKGPLLFPGKITSYFDGKEEILAVSDTGNHRILIMKQNGTILHEIGGNRAGLKDGNFEEAELNAPQGLTFKNATTLFVADTENHAIRQIDLEKQTVKTIAGNGVQGHEKKGGNLWNEQEISSPWDVCLYRTPDMDMTFYPDGNPPIREVLLIAMAGTHQIWALFLEDTVWWQCKKYVAGTCMCIAGSGREENRNNLYPHAAGFAQPSGLALFQDRKEVYIADSESSSVRRLSLVDGKVSAVVGGERVPNNLFAFGDKDGTQFDAKLQHLLGLTSSPKHPTTLLVADTYNHRLKRCDIEQNSITTLTISNRVESRLATFNEPAGLCFSLQNEHRFYLADTNNHLIKIIDLDNKFQIVNITKIDLNLSKNNTQKVHDFSKFKQFEGEAVTISNKGGKLILKANICFENGLKLNGANTSQKWLVELPNATWSCVPSAGDDLKDLDVVVSVPGGDEIDSSFEVVFDLVTCTSDTCLPKKFVVKVPVLFKCDGSTAQTKNLNVIINPVDIRIE